MSSVNPDIELPRRRDEEGDFHQLIRDACPDCGCVLHRAQDDPDLVWEPGTAWEEDCRDRSCHCHTDPVVGARRS